MAFLSEDLITSAKMRSFAPISQSTFQSSDLLTIAYEELCLKLVSDIMSVREDFFLTTDSVSLVANVDHYTLPERAIGNALKVLIYQDSGGSETTLEHIDVESRPKFAGSSGTPTHYYFEGDEVVLCPKPGASTGSLIFSYFRKPNQLIETTSAAKITGSSGTTTITFQLDTDLSSALPSGYFADIISAKSPYLSWVDNAEVQGITSTTIDFLAADISDASGAVLPQVGDYICVAGESNIAQIPDEFYPVLCQMVAVRMLASMGDLNKWNTAKAELKEMRAEALKIIKNRAENSPKRVRGNGFVKAFRF